MNCMCRQGHGHSVYRGHGQTEQQSSGCCHRSGFRRFSSKEERISMLEEYITELRSEIQGVEEHLEELKSTNKK